MPKKRSIWKRETKCIVCDAPLVNYQYMTKSQTIVYDEWLVPHMQPVGEYERFPDTLKTTICPGCLVASNEYNFCVDDSKYFYRNPRKNDLLKEAFNKTVQERFNVLAKEFLIFERDSAKLDQNHNRPANTRTKATFEKIWQNKQQYGIPFFSMVFQDPRDHVTALVGLALDRYYQMLRIAFDNDLEPSSWQYDDLKDTIEDHFSNRSLDIKSSSPRFYLLGINFLQSLELLKELVELTGSSERHKDRQNLYFEEAFQAMQLSMNNDDLSAIPCELKEGGLNLLLAKMHFEKEQAEEGKKCLRVAKIHADRYTRISSQSQQNFVNEVDDLYKIYFENKDEKE